MENPSNTKLRELQLTELEMLRDFAALCDKYGLKYFLDYGTLIGAVRHRGFIPWDDDVDISMPLKDYKKFLEVAQTEFGDKYFIQTSDTDINFHYPFAKIRKNGTTLLKGLFKKWNVHQGVWLDIFPLIEVTPGFDFKLKKIIASIANYLLMDNYLTVNEEEFRSHLGKFGVGALRLFYKIPQKSRLKLRNVIVNNTLFKTPKKEKSHLSILWLSFTETYHKELYKNTMPMLFEDAEFCVPEEYDKKLRLVYGDYMQLPPENKRVGHGKDMIIDLDNDYTIYVEKD